MNKLSKGALSMVLVGAVTFSATSALLAEQASKRPVQANASNHSGTQNTADHTNHPETMVNDSIPATPVKDVHTKVSQNISSPQPVSIKETKSDNAVAIIQKHPTTINGAIMNTATQISAPTANTKVSSNSASSGTASMKPAAASSMVTTAASTKTTTAPINHGKQVSQAANGKSATHQTKKVNNGKIK